MKRAISIITTLSAFCCGVDIAQAQSQLGATSETGTLISRRAASVNGRATTNARMTTRDFGQCVVARSPTTSEQIVRLAYGQPEYKRLMRTLMVNECLSTGELTLSHELARASVFEALYLRDFGRRGPADFRQVPSIDYLGGYIMPLSADAINVIALGRFGDCVVRANSQGARTLVLSVPDSTVEQLALSSLTSQLGPCVPKGVQVRFSRSVLRGAVSEGLYRLSVAGAASR